MTKKLAIAIIWIGCGFVNWGLTLGHFTHKYPAQSNVGIAALMAVSGPFGVPCVVFFGQPAHWLVRPMSAEERWQAWDSKELGRAYFEQHYN